MKWTAVFLALAAIGAATAPASACGFFSCAGEALSDDAYPPRQPTLDPTVRELVRARYGMGLSTAGFYNDPSLAMSRHEYYAPPPPPDRVTYAEPAPEGGPTVVMSPYGREDYGYRRHHRRRDYDQYVK